MWLLTQAFTTYDLVVGRLTGDRGFENPASAATMNKQRNAGMCTEQESCTTTVLLQLWQNQMATCEALQVLALWLAESDHSERSARMMHLAGNLMNSNKVIEPAIRRLVKISGQRFQPANDDDAGR